MKKKVTAYDKELIRLDMAERKYLERNLQKKESVLNRFLAQKVPGKLQDSLDAAFAKAFALVFEKGTAVIEKTCSSEERGKQYKIAEFTAQIRGDKKSLRSFGKKAAAAGRFNLAVSGAAGVGLGLLGIGLPDIALFTSLMLKNIYEIAMSYGFGYESEAERGFILRLIQGAVSYGESLGEINRELDIFIEDGRFSRDETQQELIKKAAAGLSKELLYMKFLQGVPIVGALGGAYDAVYMQRITKYADLKYKRRFYTAFKQ